VGTEYNSELTIVDKSEESCFTKNSQSNATPFVILKESLRTLLPQFRAVSYYYYVNRIRNATISFIMKVGTRCKRAPDGVFIYSGFLILLLNLNIRF